jgi:dTDP-4-amino-4,6-dideoxygalactose transaminase
VTERLTDRTLILPLFHELTDAEQLRVVDALREAGELRGAA